MARAARRSAAPSAGIAFLSFASPADAMRAVQGINEDKALLTSQVWGLRGGTGEMGMEGMGSVEEWGQGFGRESIEKRIGGGCGRGWKRREGIERRPTRFSRIVNVGGEQRMDV